MFFGRPTKILVAPLDWGLGHATRCIPIVKLLLAKNCEIVLGADGPQKALLQQEFPGLDFMPIPSYGISYSGKDFLNPIKIAAQFPKILSRIRQENRCLNIGLKTEKWDAVISDNRFGLYSRDLISVFITHQLHIENPFGRAISGFLSGWNYRFIDRFTECWIPDFEDGRGLAGDLSHPKHLPHIPSRYIGPLSRFTALDLNSHPFELLIILSGPEPQRTRLEKLLIDQLRLYKEKAVLVRGLPELSDLPRIGPNITIYNHLNAADLNQLIEASAFVLARSGYSTIMDLLTLRKKSILIPTPGQSEQMYLAKYLSEKKIVMAASQQGFDLNNIMEKVRMFPFSQIEIARSNLLEHAIDDLLNRIRKPGPKII